jgi:hypothetical protein
MKVLVCGSRSWGLIEPIRQRLSVLPEGSEIIHGGAGGADERAQVIARELGIDQKVYWPNWSRYGNAAGPIRNIAMLDEDPDLVIAFWDGVSRGTMNTIVEAEKRGIPTEIIRRDDPGQG